jgi:hypothetical protein
MLPPPPRSSSRRSYPIILAATVKRLEYFAGKPVSTSLTVSATADAAAADPEAFWKRVRQSPQLLDEAEKSLAEMKRAIVASKPTLEIAPA